MMNKKAFLGAALLKEAVPVVSLAILELALISWVVPEGAVFGSHTDWLSQHVSLAETIRDACVTQHTLLPDWLGLGGGANGYQFAYYGYLRLDVLVGCLFPSVSMTPIFMGYTLAVALSSVLLCYTWLRQETGRCDIAWICTVLFMTAGCLFQLHRQIMFVNVLPFLLLAFLSVKNGHKRWLPLWLLLICTSSFYYAPASFLALGWYWYRQEGRRFWRSWLGACLLAAGMAAMLLVPTAAVLLEHRSEAAETLGLGVLLTPDWDMNGLLVSAYGMGLSLVALYALLASLSIRALRADALFLLVLSTFPVAWYMLNGTLYARSKILIPFVPLVLLVIARMLTEVLAGRAQLRLWPMAVLLPVLWLWQGRASFIWLLSEVGILLLLVLLNHLGANLRAWLALLLIAPLGLYNLTASSEDWVTRGELSQGLSAETLAKVEMDPRYHYDSILSPLSQANVLPTSLWRSSMYSSVTNQAYAGFYYDVLQAPIQINNRVALLSANDPFLLQLTGARYLEASADQVPAGYTVVAKEGKTVLAENPNVLPIAYFTADTVNEVSFAHLSQTAKLDTLARETVVSSGGRMLPRGTSMVTCELRYELAERLPEGLSLQKTIAGWEVHAKKDCTLTLRRVGAARDDLLLLDASVTNHTNQPVTISVNGVKNRLAGAMAPYPNGNTRFHYKLSDSSTLEVALSAGHYTLHDVAWHSWEPQHFHDKQFTSITFGEPARTGAVLSGTLTAGEDGVLATTIPLQRGLSIMIDGEEAPLLRVNTAFAGASLSAGAHTVDVCFTPPGKHFGLALSMISVFCYWYFLWRKKWR